MNWQLTLTWFAIAVSAGYLAWRGYLTVRSARGGCGGGCGCAKSNAAATEPALIAPEQLVLRGRSR